MKLFFVSTLFLLAPSTLSAQVVFSEILYDAEGSDTDKEWVEVHNSSGSAVDLSNWVFFENNINHGLTLVTGSATLPAGAYAIIADDASAFSTQFPSFNGTLFDSSFFLSNTGETISLKNTAGSVVDTLTYNSDMGASGDGNTLQLSGSSFVSGSPTPGFAFGGSSETPDPVQTEESTEESESSSEEVNETVSSGGGGSSKPIIRETKIYAIAGGDRVVTAGASEFFRGGALRTDKTKHEYATYHWNFGDGTTGWGDAVLHSYAYPGKYVVTMTVYSPGGTLSDTDRIIVTAKPLEVVISSVTPTFIEVTNKSSREVDISHWSLYAGKQHFMFPQNTILLPHATLKFPQSVTGLSTTEEKTVGLLYSNGSLAYAYTRSTPSSPVLRSPVLVQRASSQQQVLVSDAHVVTETSGAQHMASPVTALPSSEKNNSSRVYVWLLALFTLIVASVVGLLVVRGKDTETSELTVDDITLRD